MSAALYTQRVPSSCRLRKLRRNSAIRRPQGRLGPRRQCSWPSTDLRATLEAGEDFVSATEKVNLPSVEWHENFDECYRLEMEFGAGAYGTVWKARDKSTGNRLAVKRLPTQRPNLSVELWRDKVDQEVRSMMDVQGHPGVVNLHGTFLHQKRYSVVMELCDGSDLKTLTKKWGPADERLCAAVAWGILGVLQKCREAGLVHGDLKPANFVVASRTMNPFRDPQVVALPPGWLKAIDFGAAQYFRGMPGDVLEKPRGTPLFVAPEVLEGSYGFEADMWSLGITLFYLMSGRYPLWETEELARQQTLREVRKAVLQGPVTVDPAAVGNPSHDCLEFLQGLLTQSAKSRMTLAEALSHPFIGNNVGLGANGGIVMGCNNIVASDAMAELRASSLVH